jgi:hypothetical protein
VAVLSRELLDPATIQNCASSLSIEFTYVVPTLILASMKILPELSTGLVYIELNFRSRKLGSAEQSLIEQAVV